MHAVSIILLKHLSLLNEFMGGKTIIATVSKSRTLECQILSTCFALSTLLTCVVCDCQVTVKSLR
jgi:hypothetical protein